MNEYQDQMLSHQNKETKQNIITEMKNKKSLINRELGLNGEQKVILYSAVDRKISVKVFFARDNFWLTQKTMAELFGVNLPAISKHLKNIYASKELTEEATISKMEIVQVEGGRKISRSIEIYNLDAAITVGYPC